MEHELNIDEMIANLKSNIASLATNLNNPMRLVRNKSREAIEDHWMIIEQLEKLEQILPPNPKS